MNDAARNRSRRGRSRQPEPRAVSHQSEALTVLEAEKSKFMVPALSVTGENPLSTRPAFLSNLTWWKGQATSLGSLPYGC